MLSDFFEDALFAAIAAIGFSAISNPPRRAIPVCGLIAAIGHSARFAMMNSSELNCHIVTATGIAALLIGIMAVLVSKKAKVPAETYLYPSLLPMIPGIYAYKTFGGLAMCLIHFNDVSFGHYFFLFAGNGLTCFFILLAMAAGATVPMFIMKRISFRVTRQDTVNNTNRTI